MDQDPTAAGRAIRTVAVFCGSRFGHDPAHAGAIAALGVGLAARDIGLVYGGGRIGLMGLLADAVLDAGGRVTGIIPAFLGEREVAHDRVTDLVVTEGMHDRKRRMFERADAFVTMPGGLGTLDETVEIVTWRQLGLHAKPVLIVDAGGWARALVAAFEAAVEDGFAGPETAGFYEVVADVPSALRRLETLSKQPGPSAGTVGRLA